MVKIQRLPQCDFLRAVAVLNVLLFHINGNLPGPPFLKAILSTGWSGVYLFFVLSGFLIGTFAFKEVAQTGELALIRFWIKRVFRTWPIYFCLLGVLIWRTDGVYPPLVHYFTFTQNFYDTSFFAQSWSLAVEEQFYFFFPLFLIGLIKLKKVSWTPFICLLGVIAAYLFRYHHPNSDMHTISVIDSLFCGILIAYIRTFYPIALSHLMAHPKLYSVLAILIVYCPFFLKEGTIERRVLLKGCFALGFSLLVAANLRKKSPLFRFGEMRWITFIATISYSLYLIQDRAIFWAVQFSRSLGLIPFSCTVAQLILSLVFSILSAMVLFYLCEKPSFKIRDYFLSKLSDSNC